MLHTFLSVFLLFFIIYGIEGFGVGVLPESIFARVNDTIKIACGVQTANGELNFYDGDDVIPEQYIKRANDTYIEMIRAYVRPIRKNFTCRQDRNNVGLSEVSVDARMAPVEDFKCRTKDLKNVVCSFKQPVTFLPIKYRLMFTVNGEMSEKPELEADGQGGYSCVMKVPASKKPLNEMAFRFSLHAKNRFYELSQDYEMKLLEILTPEAVEELKIMNRLSNSNSAVMTFSLPKALSIISEEILFDVELKVADGESLVWKKIENPRLEMKEGEGYLVIDHLEYANTLYVMKIKMKSRLADDVNEMWSPFREIAFKTKPALPKAPPETCSNCFNVMDNGNIVVYWKEVSKHHQNADKFSYLARGVDENKSEVLNTGKLKDTSLVLKRDLNVSFLNLQLFSVNNEGITPNFSELFINLQKLQSLKKILKIRKELVDGEYKVSWKQLERVEVESYTVFWCHQRNELPNQCDGSIKFIKVDPDKSVFTLKASESYQFGVAANHKDITNPRGFQWAECTASKPNQVGQVHSMWSSVSVERSITIHWKLNCADDPIVVGYNITYCLLDDKNYDKCSEPSLSEVVILSEDDEMYQYEIANLKSFKLYNISVALMSHTRLGVPKSPITVRTLEGAPTAPRDLKAVGISRNFINLTWNRPLEVNGELMTYELWYNNQKININDNNTMNETFAFNLEHLEAFTNYTITVVACTSNCSESSDSLTLRTAVGEPGLMFQPTMRKTERDNRMSISWALPEIKGGNLDYFQLKLIPSDGHESPAVYRIAGRETSCFIEGFNCDKDNVNFVIRSVNVEGSVNVFGGIIQNRSVDCFAVPEPIVGEMVGHFYGEWSQPIIFYCTTAYSMALTGFVVLITIFIVFTLYYLIRFYHKYQMMKDIHVIWPEGLNSQTSPTLSKTTFHGIADLDLIKDHVLTDIEEEEDEVTAEQEKEKFIPSEVPEVVVASQESFAKQRESCKSEIFLPFLCNPKTNEIFYELPKETSNRWNTTKSAPVSPEKSSIAYEDKSKFKEADEPTGYMKMYKPQKPLSEGSLSVEGYLDMSGKSPTRVEPTKSDYVTNQIQMFIKDSELNNNGYIGKRASVITDPANKKLPPIVNSNGYVGLFK